MSSIIKRRTVAFDLRGEPELNLGLRGNQGGEG